MKIAFSSDCNLKLPDLLSDTDLAGLTRTEALLLLAVSAKRAGSVSELSEEIGQADEDVFEALLHLQEKGLLSLSSSSGKTAKTKAPRPRPEEDIKVTRSNTLPSYNSEQMAKILEGAPSIVRLFDAINQIVGRMMTVSEHNTIIGMIDYLSLESDYILLLISHCVENGKDNFHYFETTAVNLVNQGIKTYKDLEDYFKSKDAAHSNEMKIRSLFGIGRRTLTQKEDTMLQTWFGEWKLPMEMVELARDKQVNAKGGDPTIAYVNSILTSWHESGFTSAEQVTAAESKKKKPKGESFESTDFFEAALRRSYDKTEQ